MYFLQCDTILSSQLDAREDIFTILRKLQYLLNTLSVFILYKLMDVFSSLTAKHVKILH